MIKRIRKQAKTGLGTLTAVLLVKLTSLKPEEKVLLYLLTSSENHGEDKRLAYVSDANIRGNLCLPEEEVDSALEKLESLGYLIPVSQIPNKFKQNVDGWWVQVRPVACGQPADTLDTPPMTLSPQPTTLDTPPITVDPQPTTLPPAGNQQVTSGQPAGVPQASSGQPKCPVISDEERLETERVLAVINGSRARDTYEHH